MMECMTCGMIVVDGYKHFKEFGHCVLHDLDAPECPLDKLKKLRF